MFTPRNPAAAYASVSVDTGVSTADPHKLILMLFDGALLCVSTARIHMEKGEIAGKGEKISQAINIIANGLKVSLDMEAGGDLSEKLAALYDYMIARLLHANIHNQVPPLNEVANLLGELKGAWEQIGQGAAPQTSGMNAAVAA